MTFYYFELKVDQLVPSNDGICHWPRQPFIRAECDEVAIQTLKARYGNNLLLIYKESNTLDGTPFIPVWQG